MCLNMIFGILKFAKIDIKFIIKVSLSMFTSMVKNQPLTVLLFN